MNDYVNVFENFILLIDVLVIVNMCWCVYKNGYKLYYYDYKGRDVEFRAVILVMSLSFLSANVSALQRHLNTFIFTKPYEMSPATIESLLSDRGFMMFTGFCIVLLTMKWTPNWFHKE
jgi:hypothetical protein